MCSVWAACLGGVVYCVVLGMILDIVDGIENCDLIRAASVFVFSRGLLFRRNLAQDSRRSNIRRVCFYKYLFTCFCYNHRTQLGVLPMHVIL